MKAIHEIVEVEIDRLRENNRELLIEAYKEDYENQQYIKGFIRALNCIDEFIQKQKENI